MFVWLIVFNGINVGKYASPMVFLGFFFQGLVKFIPFNSLDICFLHKFGYILESISHDGSMGRKVYLRIHDLVDILWDQYLMGSMI